MIIQNDYRKSTMLPENTVCPNCRHVFTTTSTSSGHHHETETRPPTPPPRIYKPTIYTNLPYVTMSNITSPKARVYRQLSGGGLVNQNPDPIKIHEVQPMHGCGGGLIQRTELTLVPLPPPTRPDDWTCLSRTMSRLGETAWFHEGLSWNDSEALLTGAKAGTFVVRESLNSNFLFAITVQTVHSEPTSVRIQYNNGKFRLDCVSHVIPIVPQFDCVVELIEYYVIGRHKDQQLTNQVFVDENGQVNSAVLLRRPLRSSVPSLKHCARLAINRQLRKASSGSSRSAGSNCIEKLILPKSLKQFLYDYPYII